MNHYKMRLSAEFPMQQGPLEGFIINFGTKNISLKTKIIKYDTVSTTLLYKQQSWTLYWMRINQLNAIHNTVFVQICGCTFQNEISQC